MNKIAQKLAELEILGDRAQFSYPPLDKFP